MAFRITVRVTSTDDTPVKVFYVTIDPHHTMQHLREKVTARFLANYPELVSPSSSFGKLRSAKGVDFCDEDRIDDLYSADEEKVVMVAISSPSLKRSIEDDPEVLVHSSDPSGFLPRSAPHRDADGFVIPNTPKRLRLSDASSKIADLSTLQGNAPPTPTSRSLSNRGTTPTSGQQQRSSPGVRQMPLPLPSDVSQHSSEDPALARLGHQTPASDTSYRLSVTPSAFSRMSGSQERSTPAGGKNDGWSKEEDAQLLEGTRLGLSTSQIVKKYGISRSASAARSRRLLLEKKHPDLQPSATTPPQSSQPAEDSDTSIAQSTRSQHWQPADELKLKHAFRLGLDPVAITRQYFFRTRTLESVHARYHSLEQSYNQSRRNAHDWPQGDLAVTGWGENENGRLRRAYMNSLDAETAHRRFFQTFSLAVVQSKYKSFSKQLAGLGLDRTAVGPNSPPPVFTETPAVPVQSEVSSSIMAPDRSSPCVRAVSDMSAIDQPISIPAGPAEPDSEDEDSRPLKRLKADSGQTFLNFKRSKGKGCDLPLAEIRAELNRKYQRALAGACNAEAENPETSNDPIANDPPFANEETVVRSVEPQVDGEDDDFHSAVSEIYDAAHETPHSDQGVAAQHEHPGLPRATPQEARLSRPSTTESFHTAPERLLGSTHQPTVHNMRPKRLYLEAVVIPAVKRPSNAAFVHDIAQAESDVSHQGSEDDQGNVHETLAAFDNVALALPSSQLLPHLEIDEKPAPPAEDASIFDIPDESPRLKRTSNPWSRLNRVPSAANMSKASSLASFRPTASSHHTPSRSASVASKRSVSARLNPTLKSAARPFHRTGYVSDSQTSFEEVVSTQESRSTPLTEQYKRRYVPPVPKPPTPRLKIVISSDDESDDEPLPSTLFLLQSSASKATPKRTPKRTPAKSSTKHKQTPAKPAAMQKQTPAKPQLTLVQTPAPVAISQGGKEKPEQPMSPHRDEPETEDMDVQEVTSTLPKSSSPPVVSQETEAGRLPIAAVEQTTLHDFFPNAVPEDTVADGGVTVLTNDDASSVASISDWISPPASSASKPVESVRPSHLSATNSPIAENGPETSLNAQKSFIDFLDNDDTGGIGDMDLLTTQQLDSHIDDISEDVFAILASPPPQPAPVAKAKPLLKSSLKKRTVPAKKTPGLELGEVSIPEPNQYLPIECEASPPGMIFSAADPGMSSSGPMPQEGDGAPNAITSTVSSFVARSTPPKLKSALKKKVVVEKGPETAEKAVVVPIAAPKDTELNEAKAIVVPPMAKSPQEAGTAISFVKRDSATSMTVDSTQPAVVVSAQDGGSKQDAPRPERVATSVAKSTELPARTDQSSAARKRARRKARKHREGLTHVTEAPVSAAGKASEDVVVRRGPVPPGNLAGDPPALARAADRERDTKRQERKKRKKQKKLEKRLAEREAKTVRL